MRRWLAVTLMAPLASFGERAGNVERMTADRPTRSALIGLAGAALGIRRDDTDGQRALAASFRVATATIGSGTLLSDFHTYQSLPSSKGRPPTRAAALARRRDLATSITRREYRADVWYEAAYTLNEGAHFTLEQLSAAFMHPVFAPFLGRKSCPLAAPLGPTIIEAANVDEVFETRRQASPYLNRMSGLFDSRAWRHRGGPIAVERLDDLGVSNRFVRRHRRVDEPGDRHAWHFAPRDEFVRPGEGGEETP